MSLKSWVAWPGAPFGIASAALFGASTPLAKALLGEGISPLAACEPALSGIGARAGLGLDAATAGA